MSAAFRRTGQGFVREVYEGKEGVISLCKIEAAATFLATRPIG